MAALFGLVLLVNGAIPGLLAPTIGQAIWNTGFAKSFAEASTFSIYAGDIGLPVPAAISFGLPGALTTALALKLGLPPPDAYSLSCALWLGLAFCGAYALGRSFGVSPALSALGAAVWLTFPVVWRHQGYSMLAIGIALLPTYYYAASRVLNGPHPLRWYLPFAVLCVVSSFMDGYTFVMFASIALAAAALAIVTRPRDRSVYLAAFGFVVAFGLSYVLYSSYFNSIEYRDSLDFFRGWGVDITFLLSPTKGVQWLPDLLGLSTRRADEQFFGDASVYWTTFSLVVVALAIGLFASPYGDRRAKLLFLGVGAIALYLALGPSFKFDAVRPDGVGRTMPEEYALGPTGTAFLWESVPGLYNMRAVYRWIALAILGFWAVIMVAIADRRVHPGWRYAALTLLLVFNLPQPAAYWKSYTNARTTFLDYDRALADYSSAFRRNEKVVFLPAANDFLVNYAAPRMGIRSFNIGGDKNVNFSWASWPEVLLRANEADLPPDEFTRRVLDALDGTVDAVILPHFNLLGLSRWPPVETGLAEIRSRLAEIRKSDLFAITELPLLTIVRLGDRALDMSSADRLWQLSSDQCREVAGGDYKLVLAPGSMLQLSDPASICGRGWSTAESWGRWTVGAGADLHFSLPHPASTGDVLRFEAVAYLSGDPAQQRIGVRVNGETVADWVFTPDQAMQVNSVPLPPGTRSVRIELSTPDSRSPAQAGESPDPRVLGLGLVSICLSEAGEPCQ